MRSGRHIEIPLPDKESRAKIFKIHLKNKPTASDVDIDKMSQELEGYTGADIEAICEEATLLTIRRAVANTNIKTHDADSLKEVSISKSEFDKAIGKVLKSAEKAKKSIERYSKEPSDDLYR